MKLYLIRHGESEANFNNTHSGWSPVSLTEKGRMQAQMAKKHVEGVAFDQLYVSDVLRAQQTADILFPGMQRKFITVAREVNNTSMSGLTKEQMYEKKGELYLACREKFDYSPLGMDCESPAHMSNRARLLLETAQKMPQDSKIAVVSHAGFIVSLAGRVLGLGMHEPTLHCENASVSIFEFNGRRWTLRLWNLAPEQP